MIENLYSVNLLLFLKERFFNMRHVTVGIIGGGGIANGKHMPSLKQIAEVQMVAFCDIIPEKAEKAAKEFGTPNAKI